MRIIFAGTPEPAACALTSLLASNHDVIAVITRPDARKGRGRTYYPSPVKELATRTTPAETGLRASCGLRQSHPPRCAGFGPLRVH